MSVRPCGRVGVSGGGMNDAMGSKSTCKTFSTRCFGCIQIRVFDWIRLSDFSVKKIKAEKAYFRLWKKARLGLQSKKAVFD